MEDSIISFDLVNNMNTVIMAGLLVFGVSISVFIAILRWRILFKRWKLPRYDQEVVHKDMVSPNFKNTNGLILVSNNAQGVEELTLTDILTATNNFSRSNAISCGRSGMVFKATFKNGAKLAVKKRQEGFVTKEFEAEVKILSIAQHKNLVSLRAYYVHNDLQLLLYSHTENGSLGSWLYGERRSSKLGWRTRLKIAQGASRGLEYLHNICKPHIVHGDIRSSNILLDDKFEAYLTDFQSYNSHISTEFGYYAPEYLHSRIATLAGDVYSFGVVLLELLTGMGHVAEYYMRDVPKELVVWVEEQISRDQGKVDAVFDPSLIGRGFEVEMLEVLQVARECVNKNPKDRPNISFVVNWLHDLGSNDPVVANI